MNTFLRGKPLMQDMPRVTRQLCALLVLTIGLAGLWAFATQPAAGLYIVDLFKRMGLISPLMFVLAGTTMFLAAGFRTPHPAGHLASALALLLILLAGASGIQYLLPIDLGLDIVRVATAPSTDSPFPGRPAPNTCLSFLVAGMGLMSAQRRHFSGAMQQLVRVSGWLVLLMAGMSLAGLLLNLAPLYVIAKLNVMLPTTACGLMAIGMWLATYQHPAFQASEEAVRSYSGKINTRVAAILLVVVGSTAAAGFAILRGGLEAAVLENIHLTATTNATSLASTLEGRLWFPRMIVTRPSVVDTLAKLHADPQDAVASRFLKAVGDSFLTAGVGYVRFESPDGTLLSTSGTRSDAKPLASLALHVPGQRARLVWQDGYVLSVENDVVVGGVVVGKVKTEERLPNFEKLVVDIQKSGLSSDVLICAREGDAAVCAPSRIYTDSRRIPMFDRDGKPNFPINRALLNQTGTLRVLDLRKIPVLAAYTPIGTYGLGMVVKIDEDTVYAPMRQRFTDLALAVFFIIVLGAIAVRIQVQPVLSRLVREQKRTRVILENSNDAFIALNGKGLVQDWNAQAVKLFGWSEAEAIGKDLSELIIPPEARNGHRAGLARFAATGQGPVINRTIEVTAMRRDGSTLMVELSVTGYLEGKTYISNAFVRDISERKAAEKRIADSEAFLRTVTDNIPAFVAFVDAEERYRFVNAMYKTKRGLEPQEMIGRTIRDVIDGPTYDQLKEHISAALGGNKVHFELPVVHPGSSEPTHLMFDYIPEFATDGTVEGFHILAMDISVRKQAELRQADSERRADLANRAKSEFVANMSHELRTPMNAVLGITHLLGTTQLTADQRKYLEMVRKSGASLLSLLNDVLDFSKIEAGQMEIVPSRLVLADLLSAIATIMTINAREKDIELAIGVEADVPNILFGDRLRLEQVLTNIVGNAIKFTATGEVSLLVQTIAKGSTEVGIQFVVRDTGIGMSPTHMGKIFTAFSQGDSSMTRRFGGTGLGLVISRTLVRMMGGDIMAESEAGVGSVFRVTVPFPLDATSLIDTASTVSTGFDRALRVLVIDDNATSRDYLCKTVRRWGWTASAAASGPEGLQALAEAHPDTPFDVVLADFDMPDMDGIATMRAIQVGALSRRPPVVIMVTAFKRGLVDAGTAPGDVHAVLLKPITSSSLFDTLHEVLNDQGRPRMEPMLPKAAQALDGLDGVRILLAEDNELNQVVARGILEQAGAHLEIVPDGQAAVDRLRFAAARFDLVLMDVQMPVMDGFAATRLIRDELRLDIPVIAMTAGVLADEREDCIEAGMVDFIAKPVEVSQMLETIRRHLKSGHRAAGAAEPAPADMQPGVFSIAGLLAMSAANPRQRANLVKLIAAITDKAPAELDQVEAHWKAQQFADASRLLHGMRGSVGSMGAKRFATSALALEKSIKARGPETQRLFDEVAVELSATVAQARDWLRSAAAPEN